MLVNYTTGPGYAKTPYVYSAEWSRFTAEYLPSASRYWITDLDNVAYTLTAQNLTLGIVEHKCTTTPTTSKTQRITFGLLDYILRNADDVVPFKAMGKTYAPALTYGGVLKAVSYNCSDTIDRLEGNLSFRYLTSPAATTAHLDAVIRDAEGNFALVVRRGFDNPVTAADAVAYKALDAAIRSGLDNVDGVAKFDWVKQSMTYHGLHLLEHSDAYDIASASLRWDGKPSDLRTVVSELTFGKITDATPPAPPTPILSLEDLPDNF